MLAANTRIEGSLLILSVIENGMNHQFLKSVLLCNALAILVWIIGMLLMRRAINNGRQITLPVKKRVLLLTLLYLASLISITLVPLPFSVNRQPEPRDLNFVPIITTVKLFLYPFRYNRMALLPDLVENILGNILMFIPMGILLPVLFEKLRQSSKTILIACGVSIFIELMQWVSRFLGNYRHVDIDDVILNTLGAAIGFFIFNTFFKPAPKELSLLEKIAFDEKRGSPG